MYQKIFVFFVVFLLNGITVFSQIKGESLDSALYKITTDQEKEWKIRGNLGLLLGATSDGITALEFYSNGTYLFIYQVRYGFPTSLVVDTKLILDSNEDYIVECYYTSGELFTNLSDQLFEKLILEYLPKINRSLLQKSLIKNNGDYGFEFFFTRNDIYLIFGNEIAILPYSKMQNYLTPVGKNVFK